MFSKTVVLALQENSSSYGKVGEFDQAQDAERFIEDLLHAGFERERIRVLSVRNLSLVVTRKPVVSLIRSDWLSRVKLPPTEPGARPESDLVPAGATFNSQPRSQVSDAEPLWAPTGDGAAVTAWDRPLGAVSLN